MAAANKLRTFLAATALENTWDTSQPMLFLGEWCKLYDRKSIWENLDTEILTNYFTTEDYNSFESYNYTIQVYEKLLSELSQWLNKIHETQLSLKYWRIVLGPFLLWYVQTVYHRFLCLKKAYSIHPHLDSIGLNSTSYMTAINTREFYHLASDSDVWNLQLFTQLLCLAFKPPIAYREFSWDPEIQWRHQILGQRLSYSKITKLKIKLVQLLSKWRSSKVVGLCVCVHEFSKINLLRLIFRSKFRILPMVQAEESEQIIHRKNQPDLSTREELTKLYADDEFSSLVLATLKINMPLNFIEYYKKESELSEICYPYHSAVLVSTGWMQHDIVKFWAAKKAEKGTKLINIQHGGAYGMAKYFSSEWLERKNVDRFISWGWQDGPDVIKAPSILVCERNAERNKSRQRQDNRNLILWATTEAVRFPPFIGSYLSYMRQTYFDWQYQFINTLTQEVSSQVTMRIRPGSPNYKYIRDLFPGINVHFPNDRSSFFDQLHDTKILISDNFHTTFLYGLAFNIPTIMFWDKTLWKIREEANPYFEKLQNVGIYHDTPESAASMLNKIACDHELWWNNEAVQNARKQFCNNFALVTPNWLNQWKDLLLSF